MDSYVTEEQARQYCESPPQYTEDEIRYIVGLVTPMIVRCFIRQAITKVIGAVMQSIGEDGLPLSPPEPFEESRLRDLLKEGGVDHVDVFSVEQMGPRLAKYESVKDAKVSETCQGDGPTTVKLVEGPVGKQESSFTIPVDQSKRGLKKGDQFTVDGVRYQVLKALSRGRVHLKEVR